MVSSPWLLLLPLTWLGLPCVAGLSGTATMSKIPGYDGALAVSGTVAVSDSASGLQDLTYALAGLEASSTFSVHIHTGVDCDTPGGHFYIPATDPWTATSDLATTAQGGAAGTVSVNAGAGLPFVGRVITVHDSAATKVACGVIVAPAPAPAPVVVAAGGENEAGKSGARLGWFFALIMMGIYGGLIAYEHKITRFRVVWSAEGSDGADYFSKPSYSSDRTGEKAPHNAVICAFKVQAAPAGALGAVGTGGGPDNPTDKWALDWWTGGWLPVDSERGLVLEEIRPRGARAAGGSKTSNPLTPRHGEETTATEWS